LLKVNDRMTPRPCSQRVTRLLIKAPPAVLHQSRYFLTLQGWNSRRHKVLD